jgi:hypothetical protein
MAALYVLKAEAKEENHKYIGGFKGQRVEGEPEIWAE